MSAPVQPFADALASLVAKEAHAARREGSPERFADMVERLSAALGFTVALATGGSPAGIDEMLAGAEAYAHQEAVEKAPLVQLMGLTQRGRP